MNVGQAQIRDIDSEGTMWEESTARRRKVAGCNALQAPKTRFTIDIRDFLFPPSVRFNISSCYPPIVSRLCKDDLELV